MNFFEHEMILPPIIVAVAAMLLFWVYRMKKQHIFKRHQLPQRVITEIQGHEIVVPLYFDTPLECLRADGIYYGPMFQLKESPIKENQCQCVHVPLSYTSKEMFTGRLPQRAPRPTMLGEMQYEQAKVIRSILEELYTRPIPPDFSMFSKQFDLSSLEESVQTELLSQVRTRFEELQDGSNE